MISKRRTNEQMASETARADAAEQLNKQMIEDRAARITHQLANAGKILIGGYSKLESYQLEGSVDDINPSKIALPRHADEGTLPRFAKFDDGNILSFASRPGILRRQHTFVFNTGSRTIQRFGKLPTKRSFVENTRYWTRDLEMDAQVMGQPEIHGAEVTDFVQLPFAEDTVAKAGLWVALLSKGTVVLSKDNQKAFEQARTVSRS